jgi:uncharacterized protein involved in type VI secretion and phage assembly
MNFMEAPPREASLETGGYVRGLAIALVTQNKDPDQLCRVRVRFPWYDESHESFWARMAVPMAGKDRGLVMIPEVGDEVIVGFDRDDIRFPYVLGALWNGKDTPPVSNDDGKNDKRLLKSRKGHKLLFDDGARGVVTIEHVDGRRLTLDDDGVVLEDGKGNQLKIESNSGAITIQANGQLSIKAATISIEATGTLDLKANATLSVRGSLVNIN